MTTTTNPVSEKNHIFLSYSRSNRQQAIVLKAQLSQQGFNVWRDEDNIRAGDNWMDKLQQALTGCSAFILLIGEKPIERWVAVEVNTALQRKIASSDLSVYPVRLPQGWETELPSFLSQLQTVDWREDQDLPDALIQALTEQKELRQQQQTIHDNPYRGLAYFQRQHADRFFGRQLETHEALQGLGVARELSPNPERIDASHHRFNYWLQIHAPSGAGKSSLLYAGMLPLIEQGALWQRTGYDDWIILEPMMPGNKPVEMLAEKLAMQWPQFDMDELHEKLSHPQKPQRLSRILRPLIKQNRGYAVLLIVDQFEELFTFAEQDESRQFDRLVATALQDPECPLFLISTIRSDFLDRFAELPQLQALYNRLKSDYLLPTITPQGLRELIVQPARLTGFDVDNGLVEAIVMDAKDEPGALPLVESALSRLWREADSRGSKQLSKSYYDKHNGLVGMLAEQADALLDSLGEKGKKHALALLLALTSINDGGRHTRRRLHKDYAEHMAGGAKTNIVVSFICVVPVARGGD